MANVVVHLGNVHGIARAYLGFDSRRKVGGAWKLGNVDLFRIQLGCIPADKILRDPCTWQSAACVYLCHLSDRLRCLLQERRHSSQGSACWHAFELKSLLTTMHLAMRALTDHFVDCPTWYVNTYYLYICIYIYTCTYICMCTYIYIYIYIYSRLCRTDQRTQAETSYRGHLHMHFRQENFYAFLAQFGT